MCYVIYIFIFSEYSVCVYANRNIDFVCAQDLYRSMWNVYNVYIIYLHMYVDVCVCV